jgi:hypothetical protein
LSLLISNGNNDFNTEKIESENIQVSGRTTRRTSCCRGERQCYSHWPRGIARHCAPLGAQTGSRPAHWQAELRKLMRITAAADATALVAMQGARQETFNRS